MIRTWQANAAIAVMSLASAATLTARAAPVTAQHERHGAHHYVYYPARHLYFSSETQMWFWPDGDSWTRGGSLPIPLQQFARGGYNVELDVERPYEAQQDVEAGYRHHKWTPYHYGDNADGGVRAADTRHGRGVEK